MDSKRELLRHAVATLAYRSRKVLREVPAGFDRYHASETTRTPAEILAHLADLLDWAVATAQGRQVWKVSEPAGWDRGVERFFAALAKFDEYLASDAELGAPEERLFQGPVADALTHVGQLAMLRRMAGGAIRGENYFVADIEVGRVGTDQAVPHREFD